MQATNIAIFLLAFAAALAIYALGWRNGRRDGIRFQAYEKVSPVEVLLEYRSQTGFTTMRKIKILAFAPRRNGRSCLFAICNNGNDPRMFRIDRILSIATLDGEILDTRQFLTEQLGARV